MSVGRGLLRQRLLQIITPFLVQFTVMRPETRLSADDHASSRFQAAPPMALAQREGNNRA
jgi:hypothetical protein